MLKFPYGISDFEKLISESYYYLDRTDRIPLIEQAGMQLLFLRPRRFGKSLLLDMLANYYDLAKAEQFETLFGDLFIGENPTPLHNRYFVMKWDFSTVLPEEDTKQQKKVLYDYINQRILGCVADYADYLDKVTIHDDAMISFASLLKAIQKTPYKLYLFIDEYDNFANEVMMSQVNQTMHNPERYKALVHGEGLLKTVFKNIKAAATGNGLDRVFITGVSPVVLADMSSGYNIVVNIYRRQEFNDLCGFHETEVREILSQVIEHCKLSEERYEEAFKIMKDFYNGYCFSTQDKSEVYNPTLTLYFLDNLLRTCEYPEDLLDHNLAMDRNRLNYIAKLPHGAEVVENAVDESRPLAVPKLHDRFGIEDMLLHEQREKELASLLYYLGVLTMDGKVALGKLKLRIPNLVIHSLYVEKLRQLLLPKVHDEDYQEAVEIFFLKGDLQPLCDFIEPRFDVFSNRDYRWQAEIAVKTAFMMLLFDDRLYVVDSEPELKRCYADLTLIARPDARQYEILDHLLEFKFIKLTDLALSNEQVRELTTEQLKALPLVKTAFEQAEKQLKKYRLVIEKRHGTVLKLQTTAVVALGFERLLWL
ncbi:AAA family ATPase [Candidatus Venteria ishoeyi]|uniref:Putative AAA-ATPase n=1 Tax=Candidatus Venteria ishoeyi TaxID=1899563 RepID=A0A1H6FHE4_9GAMM|nr:AAA family ATPase [Candidatus Venteria ishoeyi]SEH08414.1 putative AAA-ATPase [Candidatus Venteria ishoeyi]